MGPLNVRLRSAADDPYRLSNGEIEELNNATPGVLDLPPFAHSGVAESFFDIFFEVEVGGQVYHTHQPKHMTTTITFKPPSWGETYENPDKIELYDENEQPTGIFLILVL